MGAYAPAKAAFAAIVPVAFLEDHASEDAPASSVLVVLVVDGILSWVSSFLDFAHAPVALSHWQHILLLPSLPALGFIRIELLHFIPG